VVSGAFDSAHGPAVYAGTYLGKPFRSFLNEGNAGLANQFWDIHPGENQSHHYAGIFFLSYFFGAGTGEAINYLRDSNNPGDINLGNGAAEDSLTIRNTNDLSLIGELIVNYSSP